MRRLPHLFVAVVAVATVLTFVSVRPAHAACLIFNQSNPTGTTLPASAIAVAGHTYTIVLTGAINSTTQVPNWPISGPIPAPIPPYTTLTITDDSVDCGAGSGTFFNPGDGRVNGLPGDRLVVYCNTGGFFPNLDIYVIAPGGAGKHLAQVLASDLLKPNFSLNLGSNGILTGGVNMNSAGYVALQGGPYGGTATGDWLKTFSCKAS